LQNKQILDEALEQEEEMRKRQETFSSAVQQFDSFLQSQKGNTIEDVLVAARASKSKA
jgi:hypothetical protein